MAKSLSEIAHDIAIALLPKSLEEAGWTVWKDEGDDTFSHNKVEIIEEYAALHDSLLSELRDYYGDSYPR